MKTEKQLTYEAFGLVYHRTMKLIADCATTPETLIFHQIVKSAFEDAYLKLDAALSPVKSWGIEGVNAEPQVLEMLPVQMQRILNAAQAKRADTILLCDDGNSLIAIAKNTHTNTGRRIYESESLQ